MNETHESRGTALVTGAGTRLGLAIAQALSADGWAVAFHGNRSLSTAEAAVKEVEATGGRAVALQADLSDPDAAAGLVERAGAALGPLTLLVNNAAVFVPDRVRTATPKSINANIGVNLTAPILLTRAFVLQIPGEVDGHVINILDQRVNNLTPAYMSYTASKCALATMTQTWALELAPRIRVNGVGPGMALPDHDGDEADMQRWTHGYPLQRGTSPDEICDAVRFLLATPSMTGQMLCLDGGQSLGWLHPESGYPLKPGQE